MILRLQNFCSHVDTTWDLSAPGVCLLAGPNGAGKTSLVPDGLAFAWYGRTLRGASGKDVIRRGATQCAVTVQGQALDGTPYTLERRTDQTRLHFTDGVTVYGAADVTQAVRQRITGLSFPTWRAAAVFPKGDAEFFTHLDDTDRRTILDELVQAVGGISLQHLHRAAERAAQQGEGLRAMLTTAMEHRLRCEGEIAAHQDTVQACQTQLQALEAHQPAGDPTALRTEQHLLHAALARLVARVDATRAAREIRKETRAAQRRDHLHALTLAEDATRQAKRKVDTLQALLHTHAALPPKCPTCFQPVSEDHKGHIHAYVQPRVLAAEAAWHACEQQLRALQLATPEVTPEGTPEETPEEMEQELVQQVATTRAQCTLVDARVKAWELYEPQQDLLRRRVDTARGKQQEAEQALETLTDEIARTREELQYTEHWLYGFQKGLRGILLDAIVPTLNQHADEIAATLTHGEVSAVFSTQTVLKGGDVREKFEIRAVLRGTVVPYRTCSDGERRRVDIISTLALGRLARVLFPPPELLAIDEVFDGLDQEGIAGAIALIAQLARSYPRVVVVTHDESFASQFDRVVTVRKTPHGPILDLHPPPEGSDGTD